MLHWIQRSSVFDHDFYHISSQKVLLPQLMDKLPKRWVPILYRLLKYKLLLTNQILQKHQISWNQIFKLKISWQLLVLFLTSIVLWWQKSTRLHQLFSKLVCFTLVYGVEAMDTVRSFLKHIHLFELFMENAHVA
jgi:hypothetical protein